MFQESSEEISTPELYDAQASYEPSAEDSGDFPEESVETIADEESDTLLAAEEHEEAASQATPEPQADLALTPLSAGDFTALEERVLRTVSLVRSERQTRIVAEERAEALRVELESQNSTLDQLHREIALLRTEREQVKQRVERLLSQLDALEL
jgi:hypothetical protein